MSGGQRPFGERDWASVHNTETVSSIVFLIVTMILIPRGFSPPPFAARAAAAAAKRTNQTNHLGHGCAVEGGSERRRPKTMPLRGSRARAPGRSPDMRCFDVTERESGAASLAVHQRPSESFERSHRWLSCRRRSTNAAYFPILDFISSMENGGDLLWSISWQLGHTGRKSRRGLTECAVPTADNGLR
jgi:hypothetical protein